MVEARDSLNRKDKTEKDCPGLTRYAGEENRRRVESNCSLKGAA